MQIVVIAPHGFCMGVRGALEKGERSLAAPPVYCLHELVHNELVVDDLRRRGMRFVESLDEVPEGANVLFSAHGVPPEVRRKAQAKGMKVIDATCPFVERVHRQVRAYASRGMNVVVVGKAAHAEVRGVAGEAEESGARVAVVGRREEVAALDFPVDSPLGVVCQTTLSSDRVQAVLEALRARYPQLETSPSADVCTATRDRQNAVRDFVRGAAGAVGVLVLGSASSSNTGRLVEIAESAGARAWRAVNEAELAALDFSGLDVLGVTSGASTPESFFTHALEILEDTQR